MHSVNDFSFDLTVFDDAYETLWREKLMSKGSDDPHENNYGHCHAIFIDADGQPSLCCS